VLPKHLTIVAIKAVEVTDDAVQLHALLSDGSVAACYWPLTAMAEYMTVVSEPRGAPLGTTVN
jgi:hypothetical protein